MVYSYNGTGFGNKGNEVCATVWMNLKKLRPMKEVIIHKRPDILGPLLYVKHWQIYVGMESR